MELNGIQGYPRTSHKLLNGQTFHPDLKYRTTSLWNGTTLHLDEVKAWQYLSANRDNLAQIRNYSQAISEINSNYAAQRAVGAALRNVGVGLGVAGATLDAYATYGQISQDLSIGDTVGAGRAGTAFVGRQGGGFLGAIGGTLGGALVGASIFGEAGAAAGSIAPGIGNAAFGIAGGIGGGIFGAMVGEAGVTAAYNGVASALGFSSSVPSASADTPAGSYLLGPSRLGPDQDNADGSVTLGGIAVYGDTPGRTQQLGRDGNFYSTPMAETLPPGQTGLGADNTAGDNPGGAAIRLPELSADGPGGTPAMDTSGAAGNTFAANLPPEQYTLPDSTYDYFNNAYGDLPTFGNDIGDDPGGFGGFGDFGDFGDVGFGPVVLDLNGDGISLTPQSEFDTFFDMTGDGYQHRTAWAGPGDGVLVFDANGDGQATQRNEVVFTDWDPAATSDLQALRDVFDTNHNGQLDAGDAQYASFKIEVTNADGTKQLETLAQAGVASISLTADKTAKTLPDGSSIDGQTTFTKADGSTGTAATVTFASDTDGYAVTQTSAKNADGSTTLDTKQRRPDGSLAAGIVGTISADGLTRTKRFDADGDGVTDDVLTDVTTANADGSRTETVSHASAAGVLRARITTTTSADRKTITILGDTDGNGAAEQREEQVTGADGSRSVTTSDLSPNGSATGVVQHLVSVDGQTGTTRSDLNGDGTFDLTTTDQTVANADGSRTQTVSDTNADGSLRDRSLRTTSADAASQSIQSDADGDGTYDLTRAFAISRNADGGTTTAQTDRNADGSLRGSVSTQISANGLTTVTRQDTDADGTVDLTKTDATVVGADGSRTETITDQDIRGATLDSTVVARGADGISRTTSIDADGNGKNDSVDQITTAAGAVTETLSRYQPDGATLVSCETTSTSGDGLTRTVQDDFDGNGQADATRTEQTTRNADGSASVATSLRAANAALIGQSVVARSADGLTTTTKDDLDGDGTFDFTTTETMADGSDGSQTGTATRVSADGTLQSRIVTAVSADRNSRTVTSDTDGDGVADQTETVVKQADGSTTDTTKLSSPNGTLVATQTIATSADGLTQTMQDDVDGNGAVDRTTSAATVLNKDGSRTTTASLAGANGAKLGSTITTTSATGLSTTVQSDIDGNGSIDLTETSVTSLGKDGGRSTTDKRTAGNTLLSSTTTTVSGTGFSTSVVSDLNGDGTTDRTQTDATTLNADGTRTETNALRNGAGGLVAQTVTTLSEDRNTTTVTQDFDGNGSADDTQTIAVQADGSTVDTDAAVNAAGTLIWKLVRTTAGNGLSASQTLDANGDGVTDETQSDTLAYNADGSTTETYADRNTSANIQPGSQGDNSQIVVQTSGNGLSQTITVTGNNEGFDIGHTTTDVVSIGADGSQVETRTVSAVDAGKPYTVSKEVVTDAAHGRSHTVQLDEYGTGTYNITDATVLNADGSTTQTYTENTKEGALFEKDVTTTSANGRSVTVQRDTDGDNAFDEAETTSLNADGSRTDTIATTRDGGTMVSRTTKTTSADGRSQTIAYDYDGDGATDASVTQVSVVNADGSTTQSRSDLNANGSPRDRVVTTTSANGYVVSGTIDLDGDGTAEESFSDQIVLNADGSKTETARTAYADGSLKAATVTTTSANGLTVTTSRDLDGNGTNDVSEVDSTASSGVKTSTVSYFNAAGTLVSCDVSTTSADGRQSMVSRDFNGDGVQDVLETEDHVADGNGSYDIAAADAGSVLYEGNHSIDENGVDQINMTPDGGQTAYGYTQTLRQQKEDYGELSRLYDVMLDRDMTDAEQQSYLKYQDFDGVITAVLAGTEFTQKYGTLTDAQFVEQMYQNAYGRSAKLSELSTWLSQLKAGSAKRSDLVGILSESAEHLTDGNIHAVTNNTRIVSGQFTRDHTVDRAAAAHLVDQLYLTALHRHADAAGSASLTGAILNSTTTAAQIAAGHLGSAEYQSDYGAQTDTQFVTQMFQNGLLRAPTASELSTWTQMLGAGTISRADFVAGLADSPDHYGSGSGPAASTASAAPTVAMTSDAATQSASLHRMIQAMAVTAAPSGVAWSPAMAGASGTHEQTLASAHH